MDRERRRESTTEEENRRSSARDRTLSCQPPLWTVINFSIRESHELSGLKGTHNSEKMESLFSVASFVCETLLFFCPHFSALRLPRRAPLLSSPVATTARVPTDQLAFLISRLARDVPSAVRRTGRPS